MTLQELQNIVLILANHSPTRYWKHWNYPCEEPWLMAVLTFAPKVYEPDFVGKGFSKQIIDGQTYWIIERDRTEVESFRIKS